MRSVIENLSAAYETRLRLSYEASEDGATLISAVDDSGLCIASRRLSQHQLGNASLVHLVMEDLCRQVEHPHH